MLDSRIPLAGRVSDVPGAFQNALLKSQAYRENNETAPVRKQLMEQRAQIQEQVIGRNDQAEKDRKQAEIVGTLKALRGIEDVDRRRELSGSFVRSLQERNVMGPEDNFDDDPIEDNVWLDATIAALESSRGGGQASQKGSTPIRVRDSEGNVFEMGTVFTPNEGYAATVTPLTPGSPNAPVGEYSIINPQTGLTSGEAVDQSVAAAYRTESVKQAAQRESDFITEISTRNRQGARDARRITEALQLSSQAADGWTAGAKLKMSRLLPGIDVSDEAALDTALTQLALDQLQQFKGPTTDFEFNVTRDVAGRVGDAATARRAKLKSLERAAWFNQREYDQFIKHKNAGGTVDNFKFNFGEEIKTKKGVFTLQDLQDTAVANNISIQDVIDTLNGVK